MSKLDPTDMSRHSGATMQPLSLVLEKASIRSGGFDNLELDRISDLKIEWKDSDPGHSNSGWYAKVGTRDMILSDQAIRSASTLIGHRDHRVWMKYPDRNAFPQTLTHILDNPEVNGQRKTPKRLLVRHDGIKVRAILPHNYVIRDAAELLESFSDHISKNFGEIQGVSVLDGGEPGDLASYRFVIGQNIVPSMKDELGQYMMFLLGISETGARFPGGGDAITSLGTFRTICTNSAVRESLTCRWDHKSKGLSKFMEDTVERIRTIGYYQDGLAKVFKELAESKLEVSPSDLLSAFQSERLITSGHYDSAQMYLREKTEDGRDVETQYDLFNTLTRAAHDLDSLSQRQSAETRTLHLFTEKGGIFERLRNAAGERARESALRRGQMQME